MLRIIIIYNNYRNLRFYSVNDRHMIVIAGSAVQNSRVSGCTKNLEQ